MSTFPLTVLVHTDVTQASSCSSSCHPQADMSSETDTSPMALLMKAMEKRWGDGVCGIDEVIVYQSYHD